MEGYSTKKAESISTATEKSPTFSLIWLDIGAKDDDETQGKLVSIIDQQLLTFETAHGCEQYVRESDGEQITLLVSGQLGVKLLPRIHDLAQIVTIYIYCVDRKKHKAWASQYSKVTLFESLDMFILHSVFSFE